MTFSQITAENWPQHFDVEARRVRDAYSTVGTSDKLKSFADLKNFLSYRRDLMAYALGGLLSNRFDRERLAAMTNDTYNVAVAVIDRLCTETAATGTSSSYEEEYRSISACVLPECEEVAL